MSTSLESGISGQHRSGNIKHSHDKISNSPQNLLMMEAQYAEISDPDLREQQRKTDEQLQLETALEYLASNEGSSD
jgi:hypothetical protein